MKNIVVSVLLGYCGRIFVCIICYCIQPYVVLTSLCNWKLIVQNCMSIIFIVLKFEITPEPQILTYGSGSLQYHPRSKEAFSFSSTTLQDLKQLHNPKYSSWTKDCPQWNGLIVTRSFIFTNQKLMGWTCQTTLHLQSVPFENSRKNALQDE